ncbi:FAD-dependent pyridine nucleotide-disulfide oxidoreductase [Cyanobacterium stanieri PCC 7202]|uniref:demethylphylloquinone reductase n=1 Tax=Cyanobacterium stanieri (strain ATCC 29140 / PCC 7202) TaxID=292563 RepID=K9YGM3_CYASC|nr:FAD-dependent pyridine nucleotide-disulfide oxidoreductase [Cyanobacterium stanieri PCC 7202]
MTKKILILGGGFGGLYTALRLQELDWGVNFPEITLIDKGDRFLFSPLLYELITEEMQSWEVAPYYTELLEDSKINFIQDTVTGVNLEQKTVSLQSHDTLEYDRLVIALGGITPSQTVTGAKEYAIPFRTLNDAYRVKEKLRQLENSEQEKIRVAIVGGGYSGVELGVKIADRLKERGKIRIIDRGSQILKQSPEFNRKTAEKALSDRKIWLDLETEITAIEENQISLQYKNLVDTIPVDLVLWTVGTKPVKLLDGLSLPQNENGKITINHELQVKDYPEIFALGDLVESLDNNGNILPSTAQVAFQQSDYCAWNIWASLKDKPLLPFRYQPLGEMISLGVDNATLSGLGVSLDGGLAYLARRFVYLYRLPTPKHQLKVGLSWLSAPFANLLSS